MKRNGCGGKSWGAATAVLAEKIIHHLLTNRKRGCIMMSLCRCSSMAERQLPKLDTRVRFPSSAPNQKGVGVEPAPYVFYIPVY